MLVSSLSVHAGAENPQSPSGSVHRPPTTQLVDRIEFIVSRTVGKSVVDVGFVDESRMVAKQALGSWLHAKVARVAVSAVGIDNDPYGVQLARDLGYEAHAANCEDRKELMALGLDPAEIVIAGELLEHLDQPGRFLEAVKVLVKPGGTLLISTPNACSMTNFLGSLMNREFVNPDHVSWFSWQTLTTLLGRHGWTMREFAYYGFPRVLVPDAPTPADRRRARAFNSYQRLSRPLFRFRPTLADGIIVVATYASGPEPK
jgi:SAM-dependent methyltransferase